MVQANSQHSKNGPAWAAKSLPLKDALRCFRLRLKHGRGMLDPVATRLPGRLGGLAKQTLSSVDSIGISVDTALSHAAHRYLDRASTSQTIDQWLGNLSPDKNADLLFAQTLYQRLRDALRILGAGDVLISERLAAEIYRSAVRDAQPQAGQHDLAADIVVRLVESEAIGTVPRDWFRSAGNDRSTVLVALFAVILWMQIDRAGGGDSEDGLLALCCDVARVIERSILACRGDRAKLAELLAQYAHAI